MSAFGTPTGGLPAPGCPDRRAATNHLSNLWILWTSPGANGRDSNRVLPATHASALFHLSPDRALPCHAQEILAAHSTRGLKPHVPGKVWGVCHPDVTQGKRVVWLTANPIQFKHDKHHQKSWRDPDGRLLRVVVNWDDERLRHYVSWRDPKKKEHWGSQNNPLGWFVYFGTIRPGQIIFP